MLTQHVAVLILPPPLDTDVTRDTQEDEDIVLGRELLRVQPPDYSKSPPAMDIDGSLFKLWPESWQGKGLGGDFAPVKSEACP